jgi:hypothetical protein
VIGRSLRRSLGDLPVAWLQQAEAALRPLAFPPGAGTAPATTTLEAADPATRAAIAALRAADNEPPGTVRIVTDEPRRVVVEARLAVPACVVLADTFHADWTATVTGEDGTRRGLEILRADHTLRGCLVPAGRHTMRLVSSKKTRVSADLSTAPAEKPSVVSLPYREELLLRVVDALPSASMRSVAAITRAATVVGAPFVARAVAVVELPEKNWSAKRHDSVLPLPDSPLMTMDCGAFVDARSARAATLQMCGASSVDGDDARAAERTVGA